MRLTPAITCAVLAAGLGGCTTFGTNVNGSFRCDAPDGVCAPSTVIDDNALARIEETSSTDLLNPAGPYPMDDGIDTPVHTIAAANASPVARAAPSYELSIVFPGYTDATGTEHARRVVRIEAGLPGRGDAMDAMASRGSQPSRNRGLLAAAESAPSLLAIAPGALADPVSPTAEQPIPQVAAAQEPNPLEQIEDEVKEQLAAQLQARRRATSFPGIVE
ncbi:MAG: hypothetical protein AAFR32_05300 [Pseudomonadota bacterium]